jgi:hypothetical protein
MTTILFTNGWKENYQHINLIPHTQIVRKPFGPQGCCLKGCINTRICKDPFCKQVLEKKTEVVISWLGFTLTIFSKNEKLSK